tara:strand:+ start:5256 stop:5951 length:696 start_codon:yes stop_codon:yes gene_type:complete
MSSKIKDLIENPHKEIDISITIPSLYFDKFSSVIESLKRTSSQTERVEVIVKIDSGDDAKKYFDLLSNSGYKCKVIIYPGFNKRYSCQHFYNDMAAVSSGKLIWTMPEDSEIIHGDWYKHLIKTRDCFKDNIYYVSIPMDNGKGSKQIIGAPAVSREWYNVQHQLSCMPNNDRWLHEIAKETKRRIILKEEELLMHFPVGRRVLSKQERKDVFYPAVKKTTKVFLKKIKDY